MAERSIAAVLKTVDCNRSGGSNPSFSAKKNAPYGAFFVLVHYQCEQLKSAWKMPFVVYILKSQKDHGYYYGYTADLDNRIARHNDGLVRSTKSRRPWVLHYAETYQTKTEAIKRENFFKTIDGYNWLKDNNIT
jgi:putative endonuclease